MTKKIALLSTSFFFSVLLFGQNIPRTSCNNCWNADSLGNHRAVVEVTGNGDIAKVDIPWRRRDYHPELKRIIVEDAGTHKKIMNVKTFVLDREHGEIAFEPLSGKGKYYIYYMPYKNEGRSNYPKGVYLEPENTASSQWLENLENQRATQ